MIVLAALWLGACSVSPPAQDVAGDEQMPTVACWRPTAAPKAVVIGVHGMNDHKGAFAEVGEALAAAGFALYSYDQRGFGSNPDRGQWPGAGALTEDLKDFVRQTASRHPGAPLFVFGESMGAAVAVITLTQRPALPVDGIVLSAPAVIGPDDLPRAERWLVQVAAFLLPMAKLPQNDRLMVTDDIHVIRALARDPLIIRHTRLDVLDGVLGMMASAAARATEMHLPALILYGERDPLIPAPAVRQLAAEMGGPVNLTGYPDGLHLLLRGEKAEYSAKRVVQWLERQLALASLGSPGSPEAVKEGEECG